MIVSIPKGFYNVAVSCTNKLIANTNDSANWSRLAFPLPDYPFCKWKIVDQIEHDSHTDVHLKLAFQF